MKRITKVQTENDYTTEIKLSTQILQNKNGVTHLTIQSHSEENEEEKNCPQLRERH
jgi:hypothetical protein